MQSVLFSPRGRRTFAGYTLHIDSQAFAFDDATWNSLTGQFEWEERGFNVGRSAKLELVPPAQDDKAPTVTKIYTLFEGTEVVVQMSEPLLGDARELTVDELYSFTLHWMERDEYGDFAEGQITTAQATEDDTGNHNVLSEHNRDELRVIRLQLRPGAIIRAEQFVKLMYDGEGGFADRAGNLLEAFDSGTVLNFSDQGPEGTENQMAIEPPEIVAITSTKPPGGTWDVGNTLKLDVHYTRAVEVDTTQGTPTIAALLGTTSVSVPYTGGSMSKTLQFRLRLGQDIESSGTLLIQANALALNRALIRSAQGQDAGIAHLAFVFTHEPPATTLTAAIDGAPESHNGRDSFKIRVAFSEPIGTSYRTLGRHFEVTDGQITDVRRVDKRSDLWQFTIDPSGDEDVTMTLPGGIDCTSTGAPCTSDGKSVAETLAVTVQGPSDDSTEVALTGWFVDPPAEHDGTQFEVRIAFSEGIATSYRHIHHSVLGMNVEVNDVKRVDGRSDLWRVKATPTGIYGDVRLDLMGRRACGTPEDICTADGRPLSNTDTIIILAPAALSVADARAEEGVDETIDFVVSLDRAALGTITVDYTTRDGTATAGEDYTATSGTLTFEAGDRNKTIRVPLLDDAVDEGEEQFTLTLSNASGARIEDGVATGTIENSDPLQKAWIARFGRTVASQVVDAIGERLAGATDTRITIGGQTLIPDGELVETEDEDRKKRSLFEDEDPWARLDPQSTMTARDMLIQSAFQIGGASSAPGGGSWGAWGRFSIGSFEAEEDRLTFQGDVTTGVLGADVAKDRWLAGLAVSASEGDGPYSHASGDKGEIESSLTAVYPYARFSASKRLDLWGTFGFGSGDMTIRYDGRELDHETDISMRMGAIGARGQVLSASESQGIDLAIRTDAMWVRMESDAVKADAAEGGNLAAAEADVSRVRFILEASRPIETDTGATVTPSATIGLRHDAGDAETGTGLEVGGGLAYTGHGVTIEGQVRALVAHEESGYEEWGASGSIRIDPGTTGRGLSLSFTPTWGQPGSTAEQLWGMEHTRGLAEDKGSKPKGDSKARSVTASGCGAREAS